MAGVEPTAWQTIHRHVHPNLISGQTHLWIPYHLLHIPTTIAANSYIKGTLLTLTAASRYLQSRNGGVFDDKEGCMGWPRLTPSLVLTWHHPNNVL